MANISKEAFNKFKEKQEKKNIKMSVEKMTIIAFVILVIIALVAITIITIETKNKLNNSSKEMPSYAVNFNQSNFEDTIEEVKNKSEMKRMKVYLGDIFDNIEKGNFTEIYARLDDSFKENFFPKQKVLEDYLKGEFPEDAGYVIKNFERSLNQYIYVVDIISIKDSRKKTDMKFVFEEYDLNDYRFSFSKK